MRLPSFPRPPTIAFLLCLAVAAPLAASEKSIFNVREYGAAGDETRLDTVAFKAAIEARAAAGAGEGFTITHARDITFLDSAINTEKGPVVIAVRTTGLETERLQTRSPHDGVPLVEQAKPTLE